MNFQLQDILSNPILLKNVSDETLQSWIQQYPYVPIFHLYALKRKRNYTESDLHKTAFYFNNREKLFFLLKQDESQLLRSSSSIYQKEQKAEFAKEETKVIPQYEEKIIEETTEEFKEPIVLSDTNIEIDAADETVEEVNEPVETIIEEVEIPTPVVEVLQPVETPVIADDKPLSIADRILAEIRQLKEEREKANITIENKTAAIPEPTIENSDNKKEENILENETTEEAEPLDIDNNVEENNVIEQDIITKENDKVESVELPEEIVEEKTEQAAITENIQEQTLSIQDEIIARIQRLKEERESPTQEVVETVENTQTPIEENIVTEETTAQEETIEDTDEASEQNESIDTSETIEEEEEEEEEEDTTEEIVETEITAENIEVQPLSIQDEIIARIQRLKEERENPTQEVVETVEKDETAVEENIVTEETTAQEETIEDTGEATEQAETIDTSKIIEEDRTEEIAETEIVAENVEVQPLSIQDEIIARIQRLKEERENPTQEVVETVEKDEIVTEENIVAEEKTAQEETIEDTGETEQTETIDTSETIEEEEEKDTTEEITETEIVTESIEDDAESNIVLESENAQSETIENTDELIEQNEINDTEKVNEEIISEALPEKEEVKQEVDNITTEVTTAQDVTANETDKSNDISEIVISESDHDEDLAIQETTIHTETPANKELSAEETDIKIVEETSRPILNVIQTANIELTEIPESNLSTDDKTIKDIEFIDDQLQKNTEAAATIESITEEIHTSKEEEKLISVENNDTEEPETESVPFGDVYPTPLLVYIQPTVTEVKEKPEIKIETQKEEEKSQAIVEEPNSTEEYIDHEKEISVEHKITEEPTIILVPEIKEDSIETTEANESESKETTTDVKPAPEIVLEKTSVVEPAEITEQEIVEEAEPEIIGEQEKEKEVTVAQLDEENIKEPHTFIEWLKLLDGNLQIQTTESPIEKDWIEFPKYEVEQTVANKKQIQEEENKIFTPNFEEGEIDLFNEIDEEVTKSASESVSFKQDMMTETLAKIYAKQGKTDKALEIYNALCLKFPEKSSYFATLIQKLEK